MTDESQEEKGRQEAGKDPAGGEPCPETAGKTFRSERPVSKEGAAARDGTGAKPSPESSLGVRRSGWGTLLAQNFLGIFCYFCFVVPYMKGLRGLSGLSRRQHYLFVSNHVSLLDTILIGGIFWSRRFVPLLVLGDAAVWKESLTRRLLSARLGFLIDRDRATKARLKELGAFGRSKEDFHLLVFPEGTRGNGVKVRPCQPGVYFVAKAAQAPMVPVFIENMQKVSSKRSAFNPIKGLLKVKVHFGEPVPPEEYSQVPRDEFPEYVRGKIQELVPLQSRTGAGSLDET